MYSSTSALLSKYQARISLICETETVGNPLWILSTEFPICVRMIIVSSDTREFRTRTAPVSNWTSGTVSGKLKRFVSTVRILPVSRTKANSSTKHFRHTCYKKVFVKQHFLQNRPTQYTYLSTGPALRSLPRQGRFGMMCPNGSCFLVLLNSHTHLCPTESSLRKQGSPGK